MLQNTISALDREKDNLQETVDEKTERLAALEDNLSNKVSITEKGVPVHL